MPVLLGVFPLAPSTETLTALLGALAAILPGIRVALLDPVSSIPPAEYFPDRFDANFALFTGGEAHSLTMGISPRNLLTLVAEHVDVPPVVQLLEEMRLVARGSVVACASEAELAALARPALVCYTDSAADENGSDLTLLLFLSNLGREVSSLTLAVADLPSVRSAALAQGVKVPLVAVVRTLT